MNILFVIHSLPVGGAEMLVVNYIITFHKMGVGVNVLEINHTESFLSQKLVDHGIPYHTLNATNFFTNLLNRLDGKRVSRKLSLYIKKINPDVVHYHTVFRNMDHVEFPAQRSVFTFHAMVERLFGIFPYTRPQLMKMNDNGLKFIAISSPIRTEICKFFLNPCIWNIPNGIDIGDIRDKRKDKVYLTELLSIPKDSFVIGQVGRFNKVKNHSFTISLFKDIVKIKKNVHLVFVGTGSAREIERVKQEIALAGVQQNVHLMGVREDATAIMSCFDTLIHPSLSESFSLVLVEAQANGVRCVASDAVPQEVICNNNCFSLSLKAPKDMWITAVLGDFIREDSTSLERFDINMVVKQHVELYNSIICK